MSTLHQRLCLCRSPWYWFSFALGTESKWHTRLCSLIPTNLHGDFCTCPLTPALCPPNPSPVPDEATLSQTTGQAPLLARIPYPDCCFKKPLSRRCTSSCLSSLISPGRLGVPLCFVTLVTVSYMAVSSISALSALEAKCVLNEFESLLPHKSKRENIS